MLNMTYYFRRVLRSQHKSGQEQTNTEEFHSKRIYENRFRGIFVSTVGETNRKTQLQKYERHYARET